MLVSICAWLRWVGRQADRCSHGRLTTVTYQGPRYRGRRLGGIGGGGDDGDSDSDGGPDGLEEAGRDRQADVQ